MDDSEQTLFDLAVDRERRQEQLGYVAAEQARAFLQLSRQTDLERENTIRANPIATAYMAARGLDGIQPGRIPGAEGGGCEHAADATGQSTPWGSVIWSAVGSAPG